MALSDDFKARFPEFDVSAVDQYIPILEDVWPCYYGGAYDGCGVEIVLNLLAHMITVESDTDQSSVKDVNSQSVDGVSVSYSQGYASSSFRDDWLRTTKYGQRYLMLTSRRQGSFVV